MVERSFQSDCIEMFVQRFRSELGEKRVGEGIVCDAVRDDPETPRVMVAQLFSGREREGDMIVRAELRGGIRDAQAAGHAEVDDHVVTICEMDDEIFRATGYADDLFPFDLSERVGHRLPEIAPAHDDLFGARTFHVRQDSQSGGFHFRQFRHR